MRNNIVKMKKTAHWLNHREKIISILLLISVFIFSLASANQNKSNDSFRDTIIETKKTMTATLKKHFKETESPPFINSNHQLMSIEEKVNISAPFQILPPAHCQTKIGFLIIHGLFLDPNSSREIANKIKEAYNCAVIKAILLSGHGTLPKELIKTKFTDWIKDTKSAIKTFEDNNVNSIYIVGHSLGGTLAYKVVEDTTYKDKIKGLVLFNPAIKEYRSSWIKRQLLNIVTKFIDYKNTHEALFPVRYLAHTTNAANELIKLTASLKLESISDTPSIQFHVIDDTTIDIQSNINHFCSIKNKEPHQFVLYTGTEKSLADFDINGCDKDDFTKRKVIDSAEYNITNFSHVSLIYKNNPFFQPEYYYCRTMFNDIEPTECEEKLNDMTFSHATNLKKNQIRLTTNPDFDNMIQTTISFIQKTESDVNR